VAQWKCTCCRTVLHEVALQVAGLAVLVVHSARGFTAAPLHVVLPGLSIHCGCRTW